MQKTSLTFPVALAAITAAATGLALCQVLAQGAQPLQRPSTARLLQDMQRLDWMVGKWQGSGWTDSAALGRREFSYSLNVRREFDGLLLVVDGVGYSADRSVAYAEQLLISGTPPGAVLESPGSYSWQESGRGVFLRGNDAQGTGRSLRVGLPLLPREECDWIVDESRRTFCRTGGEPVWSRATISLNDDNEWVETREWQEKDGDDRNWRTYFKVVLQRVKP